MKDSGEQRGYGWLHAYTIFVAASILVLICSGGLVTSKNAGLAVPDWPNTYGYNVFAFPLSRWVGGVLFEHVHRLIASLVGFLTLGLTVWLWMAERRRWVRNLGIAASIAVIAQAVLGGLRVVELKAELGIFHACLAQAFLALVALIALVTSRWWSLLRGARAPSRAGFGALAESIPKQSARQRQAYPDVPGEAPATTREGACVPRSGDTRLDILPKAFAVLAVLIYVQLALGATMRHAHAGLAIPDFPTAYGQAWPHIGAAQLAQINRQRDEVLHLPPTSLMQIQLQMGHRMLAAMILLGVLIAAGLTWHRRALLPGSLRRLGLAGPFLIGCQVCLGIETIWTNKAADVATAHVAVGAITLVWAVLTYAALRRWLTPSAAPAVVRTYQPMEVAV